jgi:hypothetical protein
MSSPRSRLAALAMGCLLAVGAALVALPASSAKASATVCEPGEDNMWRTCSAVTGSGLTIDSLTGSFENLSNGTVDDMHIELSGPNGLIKNCAQVNVGPLATITCTWSPDHTETQGDYCATSWHYNGSGYTSYGEACVDVIP